MGKSGSKTNRIDVVSGAGSAPAKSGCQPSNPAPLAATTPRRKSLRHGPVLCLGFIFTSGVQSLFFLVEIGLLFVSAGLLLMGRETADLGSLFRIALLVALAVLQVQPLLEWSSLAVLQLQPLLEWSLLAQCIPS